VLYPIYVHLGDETHAHGVTFPDFPGCFAAADEIEGIPAAIREAVHAHFGADEDPIPAPSALETLAKDPEYTGGVWMLADIDLAPLRSQPVRLNISLPKTLVERIDAAAERRHQTRSGFLAAAATRALEEA